MKLQKKNLGDGIRLHVIPKDTFKTDFLVLRFLVPLKRETAAQFALLPSVLCRGCSAYPSLEALSEQLDNLYNAGVGGRARRRGDLQAVNFYVRALETACVPDGEDVFSETLDVLGEVLFHPLTADGGFLSAYVRSEKKNLTDAIHSRINNKAAYAVSRCEEEMCKGEPYAVSEDGYEEDVAAITPQSLYQAYESLLAQAPLEIFYVGKRPADDVSALLSRVLAPICKRSDLVFPEMLPPRRQAEVPHRELTEEQPVRQGRLCLGFRTGCILADGDYYVFSLFNELLGGSASSKLFSEVREARSLCYDIQSLPEGLKGIFVITCGMDSQKRDETQQAILEQLEAIRAGDITDEEFDTAKKSLISGYREIEDSAGGLADWYFNRLLAGIDTSPTETAEQVRGTSKEAVIAAARRMTLDTVYFLNGTRTDGDDAAEDEEEEFYD